MSEGTRARLWLSMFVRAIPGRDAWPMSDFDALTGTTALYLHVTARRLAEVHSPLDLIGSGCIGQ